MTWDTNRSSNTNINWLPININSTASNCFWCNNIGYIRLTSFNENSSNQIKNKLKKLSKDNNIKGYILDLRNNPGGLLTQAIKISDFF